MTSSPAIYLVLPVAIKSHCCFSFHTLRLLLLFATVAVVDAVSDIDRATTLNPALNPRRLNPESPNPYRLDPDEP